MKGVMIKNLRLTVKSELKNGKIHFEYYFPDFEFYFNCYNKRQKIISTKKHDTEGCAVFRLDWIRLIWFR